MVTRVVAGLAMHMFLAPAVALAGPTFAWNGVITDPVGDPIQGEVDLTVRVFPTAEANPGEVLFTEHFHGVPAHDGHVSVVLGADDVPLGPGVLGPDTAWVQVSVDGGVVGPATPMTTALSAVRAERVGDVGAGLYASPDGVSLEGTLAVEGQMTLAREAWAVGEQYSLTIDGQTFTDETWTVVVEHPAVGTFLDIQMSFSHCGGGCHYAYRHWTGYFDAQGGTTTVENVVAGGANGGTWTLTRLADTADGMARTQLQKTRDPRYHWGGDSDIWIDSNRPVTLVSQSDE